MSVAKGTKKSNSRPTRRPRANVIALADGTLALSRQQTPPRRRKSDKEVFTTHEKIEFITRDPRAYHIFDEMSELRETLTYPLELLSVLHCLRRVFPHARELTREIGRTDVYLAMVWDGVLRNSDPEDHPHIRELAKHGRFPDRTTLGRLGKRIGLTTEIREAQMNLGLEVAVNAGAFDPNRADRAAKPNRQDVVSIDGTVHKSPTKASASHRVDRDTGEITRRRVDSGAQAFTEGGTSAKVWGTKTVSVWARAGTEGVPVPIGMDICRKVDPAGEADVSTRLVIAAEQALATGKFGLTPRHIMAVVGDGAPIGKHAVKLADHNILLHNPPAAKSVGVDPETGAKTRLDEHEYVIAKMGEDGCDHVLVARGGDTFVKEIVNGQSMLRIVEGRPRYIRRHKREYVYFEWKVECLASSAIHTVRLPLHKDKHESDDDHRQRLHWTRAWGRTTPTGRELKGQSNTVESFHSRIDSSFRNGRIPAYGDAAKVAVLNGYLCGEAILADAQLHGDWPPDG